MKNWQQIERKKRERAKLIDRALAFIVCVAVLILMMLFAPSCASKKQITTTTQTDSTGTKKTVTDSLIKEVTPAIKTQLTLPNPCDSNGVLKAFAFTQTAGKTALKVRTIHDTLYVDCACDESIKQYRLRTEFLETSIKQMRATHKTDVVVSVIEVTPWYTWLLAGILATMLLLSWGYILFGKIFRST